MARPDGLRSAVALTAVLAGLLLAPSPAALALDPALDVDQYAHTSWKIREGFTRGAINAIAQTPDGYLWLGTEFGLFRFDGVRSVPWQPPADWPLASTWIRCLLVGRDGSLWIGTLKGLARWRGGELNEYPQLSGQDVFRLLEDREGVVWIGTLGIGISRLCAIRGSRIECHGEDGRFGPGILSLREDSKGELWVGVKNGVWRWKPGPPRFYPLSEELN